MQTSPLVDLFPPILLCLTFEVPQSVYASMSLSLLLLISLCVLLAIQIGAAIMISNMEFHLKIKNVTPI